MNADTQTSYMDLDLPSPIIASSSGITEQGENVERLERAGAGAVVLKSLFEEEINAEVKRARAEMERPGPVFPDMADMEDLIDVENGVANYLSLIKECKRRVDIPVIASVNCLSAQKWTHFARTVQEEGADALELNIFLMPSDVDSGDSNAFEQRYFEIIAAVLQQVTIPVAVKLSPYFSTAARTFCAISQTGIKGLVLFNRFFSPDYDLEELRVIPTNVLSSDREITLPLRWIAILYGRTGCDLAASTGIHDGNGVIKQILAGASAVQVASALYIGGIETVEFMNTRLVQWMTEHGFASLADFRGTMGQQSVHNPAAYDRVQFLRNYRSME